MRPITKKDVIDMPSALNNQVNLCDSCTYTYPECPSEKDDVIFGNGIGNDNICACNKYQPTVQPVATDTNVGDTIGRQNGEWIDYTEDGYVECPFCHSATNCDGNKDELHFCFSCGADMRGEQDERG